MGLPKPSQAMTHPGRHDESKGEYPRKRDRKCLYQDSGQRFLLCAKALWEWYPTPPRNATINTKGPWTYTINMKVEWNKVTWYSKTLALALFVALPFAGFSLGVRYGKIEESTAGAFLAAAGGAGSSGTTAPNGLIPYYGDTAEWQTDANNVAGGFSIAYPIDFPVQDNYSLSSSTDWRVGADGTQGTLYLTLTVPKAFEPQTNFSDARLTVGASGNAAARARCLEADATRGPAAGPTSTAMIGGVPFTVFRSSDAGAGNYYDTTSYRTIRNGMCYAIEYTVHSAQIYNYPASYGLRPFSAAKIDALMENVVGTFKFL